MRPHVHPAAFGGVLAAAVLLTACQGSLDLDEIPEGTEVVVETQDGRLVTGSLRAVDPEAVTLSPASGDGRISVTRSEIAEVQPRTSEAAEAPRVREVTIPAGTTLHASLETALASDSSQAGAPVRATLTSPLEIEGATVAPSGSVLLGSVTQAQQSGRVSGRAALGLRFDRLETRGVTYDVGTTPLLYVAEGTREEDAAKIGVGAAVGAVIGGITGGGKGAAVGSAIGGGGGTAVVLATRGEEVRLGAGQELSIELSQPMAVTVPVNGS